MAMNPTPENLTLLSSMLSQSLSPIPTTRHAAEKQLSSAETTEGFLLLVLTLVKDERAESTIRQAAGVYFKNVIRKRWSEDSDISNFDRTTIKSQLIPIMVSLSTPSNARLQSQIGEAISEIATLDFPERWPNLLDDMVNSFSAEDMSVNNGVLTTAHSIFKGWRSAFRTNELFTTIKVVLDKMCAPYWALFQRVDGLITSYPAQPLPGSTSIQQLAQTLILLLELFHDLTAQDLPEFFEDHNADFMGSTEVAGGQNLGLVGKWLTWQVPELLGDEDDDLPGPIQRIRAIICEIAELWSLKYADAFPQLGMYVNGVWQMLTGVGMGTRDDQLVSRSLNFLSVVVKMGPHRHLFESQETLQGFCERIILPNMTMRTHEEEMFEDDPIEFIRQDLEVSPENDTRRQAASEFTQSLLQPFEAQITQIIGGHIQRLLAEYNSNPTQNWKAKDTALYLLTSIAARGSTQHAGVTSTNALVDVVQFFSENVFSDLQASPEVVHPILQVDAIRYLYTFRNKLTRDQLLAVLPLLVQHLEASNFVVYSYAAITIERILFIKQDGKLLFTQEDVRPFAESILMACFRNIESGSTPEKIAENDYLMKCVMRVIITARQVLLDAYQPVLNRLVAIIGETSKNPSNPRFNQYNFEAISALIRFVAAARPDSIGDFENALFPPIQYMLSAEVSEFIPYAFQLCSQLLELHPVTDLPPAYENLLAPLLHASLWESRGNVPALVRLWKALITRGANVIVERGHLQGLLGIFQKLIASKLTDIHGFDLIQAMYEFVPLSTMQGVTRSIFLLILNRLQTGKTPQFSEAFSVFFLFLCALDNVGPKFVVEQFQAIQPGLISQVLENFILPETRKTKPKNRKVVAIGLTRLLTKDDVLLQPGLVTAWPMVLEAALDLFLLPQDVTNKENSAQLDELDPEDSSFQASFSRLGASESAPRDPFASVADPNTLLAHEMSATSARNPGTLQPMISTLPQETTAPLLGSVNLV